MNRIDQQLETDLVIGLIYPINTLKVKFNLIQICSYIIIRIIK